MLSKLVSLQTYRLGAPKLLGLTWVTSPPTWTRSICTKWCGAQHLAVKHEHLFFQWIGLGENWQENPIFNGKNPWFPVNLPWNQSIEIWSFHSRAIPGTFQFNLRWRHVGVTHHLICNHHESCHPVRSITFRTFQCISNISPCLMVEPCQFPCFPYWKNGISLGFPTHHILPFPKVNARPGNSKMFQRTWQQDVPKLRVCCFINSL